MTIWKMLSYRFRAIVRYGHDVDRYGVDVGSLGMDASSVYVSRALTSGVQ